MSKVEPTYRWSRAEAEANGETILWLESYRVNCACARFIEKQISANYADNRLNEQGVKTAKKKIRVRPSKSGACKYRGFRNDGRKIFAKQ